MVRTTAMSLRMLLGRLWSDQRGNTLAMMTLALIPLVALMGSGLDMTRAYVAQNRFRQACDAGSLAGRRMLAGLTLPQAARDEATKYFMFDFPQGYLQSAPYTLTMSVPTAGTLQISSQTTVPTTLMSLFGFDTLPISTTCSATQDFVNTDIMFVFDLSGSMNCAPGVTGYCGDVEQSGSRMGALRSAATSFYDTLETAQSQLAANNLRLRYGFVNYNSTVNVGRILYEKNPDWMVQSWSYQSRTPDWIDATAYFNGKSACNVAYTYDSQVNQANPNYTGIMGGWWLTSNRCSVIIQSNGNPDGYTYGRRSVDVRPFLASNLKATNVQSPTPIWQITGTNDPSDDRPYEFKSVWNGCIEERKTNSAAINGGSSTTAPSDAYDLDVDLVPYNDDTRWRPMWNDVSYYPDWSWSYGVGRQPVAYCPTEAKRLQNYHNNRSGFVSYLNGLVARGGTYHDIGMIWGARFLSTTGLFKSATPETNDVNDPDNPEKIRGFSVKKYMIFMTDGDMSPTWNDYSAYGIEYLDGRVNGSPTTDNAALLARHLQRFRMACNAAKAKGIDIWVIAFSTTLTADMTNCASKPEQAAGLSSNAALIAKFKEIGSKIGSLRLSQ